MSQWIWSGRTALLWGSVAFALMFVPAVVRQYRRWGDWNLRRLGGTFALALYATALVTYTWLPLPPRDADWCAANARGVQAVPFAMVGDIVDAAARAGSPLAALGSFAVLQVVFNVLLFVPLGLIVRQYYHRGLGTTVLVGLATTLLVESTQATGLWGFYPCAYRVGDVDDLLTNTTGALLGGLLAPVLLWWMPDARLLAAARLAPRPVTTLRRWTGQFIDLVVFGSLLLTSQVLATALTFAFGWTRQTAGSVVLQVGGVLTAWAIVFVLPPWRFLAASPGQAAVWLTPVWSAGERSRHGTFAQRLARANVVAGPVVAWLVAGVLVEGRPGGAVGVAALVVLMAAAVLSVPVTGGRGLTGVATGARFVDVRSLDDEAARRDLGGVRTPLRDRGSDPDDGRTLCIGPRRLT